MKPIFHLTTVAAALALAWPALAQYEGEIEIPEYVLEAIREFNERAPGTPNEVLVVLDPPTEEESEEEESPDPGEAPDEDPDAEEIDDVVASILAAGAEEHTAEETEAPPAEPAPRGPEVRVQALRDSSGADIKAGEVEISAPFAAKPLGRPPAGWKLVSSSEVSEFTENVEVSPGTWLTLSIRPHVLVPEADGHSVFQIREPGFDPALGYRQEATVSSAIATSIRQLEDDARVLGQVIDDLEQILISLPRPANLDPEDNENNQ